MVSGLAVVLLPAIFTVLIYIYAIVRRKRKSTFSLWLSKRRNIAEADKDIDLSIVIPAYNEELRLPKMLDATLKFLEARCTDPASKLNAKRHPYRKCKFDYEMIIVDDGSKDLTTKCALRYRKDYGSNRIKVLTLRQNRGKGGAVREGVLASRGNYIIFADADGASEFSDICKLEKFMFDNKNSDMVVAIGSRAHMEEEAKAARSLFRTILMKGFHFLVWISCVRTIRDTQCGFKMFNRKSAHILFTNYHTESWAFDVELLYLAEQLNCKIGEIAIKWREIEGSKIVPILSWVRMGIDVLRIAALYRIGIYDVPEFAV